MDGSYKGLGPFGVATVSYLGRATVSDCLT
jgi:hypothetical protein